jgi:RsiW-degrading membrane proteinase PrsW (M82 family)
VFSILRKHKNNGAANAVAFAVIAFSVHGLFDSVCANYSLMFVYFSLIGVAFFITMLPSKAIADINRTL